MKKNRCIFGIIFIVALVIMLLFCLRSCHNQPPPDDTVSTESPEPPKSLDFEALAEQDKITIPAVTGLYMAAGKLNQEVNFYNPEKNNCYFQLSLYLSDDTLLYQSELIKPAETISEITLSQKLNKGIYRNCQLVFDCFTMDDAHDKLNSGSVILEITAR